VTIFGPDVSSFQNGLDLSRLAAASFVIAKTTEGTYYTDSGYQGWRQQAARLGKPFVWYHFLSGEDAHAQAAHTAANVGDTSLPGMLDVEPAGSFSPTLSQTIAYVDAARSAGLALRLVYLPRWYWQQIGSPDLSPLSARGLSLISSSYPGGSGGPAQLYPGDSAAGWQAYGGLTPLLYQYTNQASDGGMNLDYNAFRGTVTDLLTSLGASTMGTIPPSISQKWPELAGDFPPNATFTDESALIWADGGARAAALYALQARDAVNALAQRIQQPPAVDVNALAAALAPLVTAGATADQIAAAVVTHLASTLAKG
jgi:hypothetical protein